MKSTGNHGPLTPHTPTQTKGGQIDRKNMRMRTNNYGVAHTSEVREGKYDSYNDNFSTHRSRTEERDTSSASNDPGYKVFKQHRRDKVRDEYHRNVNGRQISSRQDYSDRNRYLIEKGGMEKEMEWKGDMDHMNENQDTGRDANRRGESDSYRIRGSANRSREMDWKWGDGERGSDTSRGHFEHSIEREGRSRTSYRQYSTALSKKSRSHDDVHDFQGKTRSRVDFNYAHNGRDVELRESISRHATYEGMSNHCNSLKSQPSNSRRVLSEEASPDSALLSNQILGKSYRMSNEPKVDHSLLVASREGAISPQLHDSHVEEVEGTQRVCTL